MLRSYYVTPRGLGQENTSWEDAAGPIAARVPYTGVTPVGGMSSIFSTITEGIKDIVGVITAPEAVGRVMDRIIFGTKAGVTQPVRTGAPAPAPSGFAVSSTTLLIVAGVAAALLLSSGGKKKR